MWIWQRALLRAIPLITTYGIPRNKFLLIPCFAAYYLVAFAVETLFQIREAITMKLGIWIVAIIVLVGPPILLWKFPNEYTPVVETLLNAILFGLALYLGRIDAIETATKAANAKWLPQAVSACNRLLTVCGAVRTYRSELASTCANAQRELPELEQEKMKAVRMMLSSHCNHGSARLNDVANHLEDALEDWQRFIGANCSGDECSQISSQINQRRLTLESQISGNTTCVADAPPSDEARISLAE